MNCCLLGEQYFNLLQLKMTTVKCLETFCYSATLFQLHFFYKKNYIRTRGSFLLKIKIKLRTISASAEEQSLKFSVKAVNKKQQEPHN